MVRIHGDGAWAGSLFDARRSPPSGTLWCRARVGGLFHWAIVQSGFALTDLPAGGIFPTREF
jgi:hypothetical protein